jgi:hypothetical protein
MPVCSECVNEGECTGYCRRTITPKEQLEYARKMAELYPEGWSAFYAGAKWAYEMINETAKKGG